MAHQHGGVPHLNWVLATSDRIEHALASLEAEFALQQTGDYAMFEAYRSWIHYLKVEVKVRVSGRVRVRCNHPNPNLHLQTEVKETNALHIRALTKL